MSDTPRMSERVCATCYSSEPHAFCPMPTHFSLDDGETCPQWAERLTAITTNPPYTYMGQPMTAKVAFRIITDDARGAVQLQAIDTLLTLLTEYERHGTPERFAALERAIEWALGESGEGFATRREGEGAYWWRTELRRRATGEDS